MKILEIKKYISELEKKLDFLESEFCLSVDGFSTEFVEEDFSEAEDHEILDVLEEEICFSLPRCEVEKQI